MLDVVTGFAIILAVILVGYLLGRFGVFSPSGRRGSVGDQQRLVLNRVAFYAATPALLFTVVAKAPPQELASPVVAVSVIVTFVTVAAYFVASRLLHPRDLGTTAMGAAAASYVNSNNIGLPVSLYVLGTGAYVPPIMVFQMVVLTPLVLAAITPKDPGSSTMRRVATAIRGAVLSPVVIAAAAGLVVSVTGVSVPDPVMSPLEILGGASIPLILMSFGASLNSTKVLDSREDRPGVFIATALKLLVMPALAWGVGVALGLSGAELYAAVILAALPTAQNVYNYAATYDKGTIVARDTVFLTTFAALPVMLGIAFLFGH